ncbi:MAG: hypothetical protein H5U24_16640 [Thioclava marina]|uniref:hypothetical protein n=1 Tax=Thioclava marina TaxID=1915077 RepID=UPI0019B4A616|nr:hypothetical protein [Thioclava marina]MBC7147006.1 hypothetical protein [Thioclava marina]
MIDRDVFKRVIEHSDLVSDMKTMTFPEEMSAFDVSFLEDGHYRDFLNQIFDSAKQLLPTLPEEKRGLMEVFIGKFESGELLDILKKISDGEEHIDVNEYISLASSMCVGLSMIRGIPAKDVLFELNEIYKQIATGVAIENLNTERLVALAADDRHARDACDKIVAMALANDHKPPEALRRYMVKKIMDGEIPRKQGRPEDGKSRVRIHNQNMTTAARAQAERKTLGHLS